MKMKNILMFDVESDGLYGKGFAVGAVVVSPKGIILDKFELKSEEGERNIKTEWVKENVLPNIKDMPTCKTTRELRTKFYIFLQKHKGCRVFSDCNYPVETSFLVDVVNDDLENRQWNMPFPLEDCCTAENVLIDKQLYYETGHLSLRKHNPYDDAVVSAYFLLNHELGKKCL